MKRALFFLVFGVFLSAPCVAAGHFTFVFLHKRTDLPVLPKEEVDKIMEGHMANIKRLAAEKKLIAAGPFEGGGGLFIFNSVNTEEVREWLSTDPGVKAQRWNIEILPYQPLIGGVCSAGEPYEMVTYTFIHFKPNVMKFNVQNGDDLVRKHNDFCKTLSAGGNVVTSGSFGGLDGGILVMRGEVQASVLTADAAVQEGLFEPEMKKLWIAKGAFCEK